MSNHFFTLTPRDMLFMHDARPMESSDAGQGANWPRPDQLWNAIINNFHRQWPERQSWEGDQHTLNDKDKHADSSFRFGSLLTCGPFPQKTDEGGKAKLYLPTPLDLSIDANGRIKPMVLVSAEGTDLPAPLKYSFQVPVLGKQSPPVWLSAEDYRQYLNGNDFPASAMSLYVKDRNIGIAINSETGTVQNGKLYQAEYLRLEPGVSMAFSASCDIKPKHSTESCVDVFQRPDCPRDIIIGGQQGIAYLEPLDSLELPKAAPQPGNLYVRWTLLSPLVSTSGWMPHWINPETGQVMLKVADAKPTRLPHESRDAWRQRCKACPAIGATLVAARIGKPLAFSGWNLNAKNAGVPKPTRLAVPAGSCYVFECKTTEDVMHLWDVLDGKRQSSFFGEKGFGIGICSSYKFTNF